MNQPPLQNPDLQPNKVIESQAVDCCPENDIQGNGNRAIQGKENLGVLGDGNTVSQNSNNLNGSGSIVINQSQISLFSTPSSENTATPSGNPKTDALKAIGKKVGQDEHKFEGKLVSMQVDIYEYLLPKEICVKLSISFGTPEVNIPNPNPLLRLRNETIDIKYGIKNGELSLDFRNGEMLLNQRENIRNKNDNWEGSPVGNTKLPIWEFRINNESINGNQPQILRGNLKDEVLGILELLDLNAACEVNAYFKISVNRINIAIIDLDDGTNKKQKETKIGLLLRYLKSELENYVSKVVIRYEPASLS
jgi:hypothetical protein